MFLWRAGRISSKTVNPAFRRWFLVNRQREVTGNRTEIFGFHRDFFSPSPGLEPASSAAHLDKLDSSCSVFPPQRVYSSYSSCLSPLELHRPTQPDLIGWFYAQRRQRKSAAAGRGWSPGSTMTVQTRSRSTTAVSRKSQEEQTDPSREDVQTSKDDSSASSSEKSPGGEVEPEGGKPSKTQQLKKVFKEYGAVGVSFHVGISLMSLGMFYLLISSGIDMASLLCKLGFSEAMVQSKMAAGTSTFVLAYAVHKLFAPARISVTLVSVPLIVRYLRKTGLFKTPTP